MNDEYSAPTLFGLPGMGKSISITEALHEAMHAMFMRMHTQSYDAVLHAYRPTRKVKRVAKWKTNVYGPSRRRP